MLPWSEYRDAQIEWWTEKFPEMTEEQLVEKLQNAKRTYEIQDWNSSITRSIVSQLKIGVGRGSPHKYLYDRQSNNSFKT